MVRNLSDVTTLPGYVEPPSKLPRGLEGKDLGDEDPEPLLNDLDAGALVNELMRRDFMPGKVNLSSLDKKSATKNSKNLAWKFAAMASEKKEPGNGTVHSYRETQLVLTKLYDLIEQR